MKGLLEIMPIGYHLEWMAPELPYNGADVETPKGPAVVAMAVTPILRQRSRVNPFLPC